VKPAADRPPLRLGPTIRAVDLHAGGEPGRVIVGGVDGVPGGSMFDAMTWLQAHRDDLRLRMVREPRGYPAANCNLVLPSSNAEAAAGYVIMEQVEYPGMSGTNTMCVVTALLETGMLPMTEPVTELTLEAPAGLIRVRAACADGKVTGVTFRNVPAFATHLDAVVEVPHLGSVTVDVAYGGMFYVIASAEAFGLRLTPDEGADIVRITEMIKAAANVQLPVVHPEQPGFAGISNNSWRDQDHEFCFANRFGAIGEQGAHTGDVTEYRNLCAIGRGLVLDHTAERQHLAVIHHHGRLDPTLLDCRRIDV
jgi:proline racemase